MRDPKLDELITMLSRALDIRRDHLARRSGDARLNDPVLNALSRAIDFLVELRKQRGEAAS
jgi:hypothetical protein